MPCTLDRYQSDAARFEDPTRSTHNTRAHAALGLTGEAGEAAELVKKDLFHGRPLSTDDLLEEIGDVLWHLASLCTAYGLSLEDAAACNISKLDARYPAGFVLGGGARAAQTATLGHTEADQAVLDAMGECRCWEGQYANHFEPSDGFVRAVLARRGLK